MSEIRKVKCDRCETETDLIGPDNDRPNGWAFLKDLDLCPDCHTAYKAQFAQMQDLFFKAHETPVMRLIRASRSLLSNGVTGATIADVQALHDALDEIDPPQPAF